MQKCKRLQKRNGFYCLIVCKIIWLKNNNCLAWEEKYFHVSNLFSGRRTTLRFLGTFSVQFMWHIYEVSAPLLWSTLLQVYPIIEFCSFVVFLYSFRTWCARVWVCVVSVCLSVCLSVCRSVCAFDHLSVWAFAFLACGVLSFCLFICAEEGYYFCVCAVFWDFSRSCHVRFIVVSL